MSDQKWFFGRKREARTGFREVHSSGGMVHMFKDSRLCKTEKKASLDAGYQGELSKSHVKLQGGISFPAEH